MPALSWRRPARTGAAALCALFGVTVLLHVPEVAVHPLVVGAWNGLAEQLALMIGACLMTFGLVLLSRLHREPRPQLDPAGPEVLGRGHRGVAHMLAGVAVLTRIRAHLAAVLLTVMFALFGLLVHAPLLFADAGSHLNWVMNAMNLALTGAAWVAADSLAALRMPARGDARPAAVFPETARAARD